jgi:hypothetical protein
MLADAHQLEGDVLCETAQSGSYFFSFCFQLFS